MTLGTPFDFDPIFSRTVGFDQLFNRLNSIAGENAQTSLTDGLLIIRLEKIIPEELRPKKINISTTEGHTAQEKDSATLLNEADKDTGPPKNK